MHVDVRLKCTVHQSHHRSDRHLVDRNESLPCPKVRDSNVADVEDSSAQRGDLRIIRSPPFDDDEPLESGVDLCVHVAVSVRVVPVEPGRVIRWNLDVVPKVVARWDVKEDVVPVATR